MTSRQEQSEHPQHFHDITLKNQCLGCGGALEVRVSPDVAWSYCRTCRLIARSAVAVGPKGPVVALAAAHA